MNHLLLAATGALLLAAPAAASYALTGAQAPPLLGWTASNLPASVEPLAGPNLVANPGFETGDFTGWVQVNDTSFTGVGGVFDDVFPTEGAFQAFFGPVDPGGGGIIQTIATTAGTTYALSFDLADLFEGPNAFGLFWDGGFVYFDFDVPAFPYTTFTTQLTATGASTDLGFIFYHSPSYWLLDNISLTEARGVIPEPATWAMMIAGFGLVGAAARRRRTIATA